MSIPSTYENAYANLVEEILLHGEERQTRNAKTKSIFGCMLKIQTAQNEFPILQGRKMFYKGVIGELVAMLKGPKHIDDFTSQGCNYWAQWAKPDGSINVDYGNAWLDFNGINQLQELIEGLKKDPYGRRHIVTGWRPDRLKELSLPCCHLLYQWYVRSGPMGRHVLDMVWYQRSVDTMIGLPSDVILAYVWNLLLANELDMIPGTITMMLGDTHIYESHYSGAIEYLSRVRKNTDFQKVSHKPVQSKLFDFVPSDFEVLQYNPLNTIAFDLIA